MSEQQVSPNDSQSQLTQHAMLVMWGAYAQQIGLVDGLSQVALKQKTREHRPQTKIIEFLLAILAGLPHLQDLSRAAHPLDQDKAVAEAWGQPAWADYSGVSRTLQSLSWEEVDGIVDVLNHVTQSFIEQEAQRALGHSGRLVYDADLTSRPVSNTSTTYPGAAFGYMGDSVGLGYQAALVSMHSPTYGRLWLANQLHPGDTVSSTQAQALVRAAEASTGYRPLRRTSLVAERLAKAQTILTAAEEQYESSYEKRQTALDKAHDTRIILADWSREMQSLEADYQRSGREPTPHCGLSRARRKVVTYQNRLPRVQKRCEVAERRLQRCEHRLTQARTEVERLHRHHEELLVENQNNPHPVRALFRVDGGFATQENIAWLIEMGYDIDTKARSTRVRDNLIEASLSDETSWQRVGGNATLTAWADTTADGYFTYPVDLALARYQTGKTVCHSVLVHYSDDEVTSDLDGWFHRYNGRQTIEAGIKEGKNIFQMHHLKVRSPQALLLQEHFACFAANFVRFAAPWLTEQVSAPPFDTRSVKQMVQVCAHTSAWVKRVGDTWLLRFTEQSLFAGISLQIGCGAFQLPLPLFQDVHFCHF